MSEHRTAHYPVDCFDNSHVLVEPAKARLLEAGWRAVSSVWSDRVPDFWEEELKGRMYAHATAGGVLTVVYEHDPDLPVLPSLRAAVEAAAVSRPDVEEALRRFTQIALHAHLPIGQEPRFIDAITPRETFMGEVLAPRLRLTELAEAYRAIPPRVRLEMERADADTFFALYGA
jgi:hypothetical protein